jgi:alkanesulfonate monooxygenase SsuD/methylene tetrahydromethanopterin reductase-like flavin-dependent oxidoreductase (luciferase family)
MSVEFSVFLIGPTKGQANEAAVQKAILREAKLAEELGFDCIWLAEHHFDANFSTIPSPNLLLAAISQVTERIKIGNAINVLPFHHPLRIAEEGAMLDLLSNGRFQWGIGRGITGHEFDSFGVSASDSRKLFNEIHDAVIDAWQTGQMTVDGEMITVPRTDIVPSVVQRPHPPVWVTAQSPDSVAWCAQHDYPAMQIGETLDRGREQLAHYRSSAVDAGVATKRGGIVPSRQVFVAATDAEAIEGSAERLQMFWDHAARTTAPDHKSIMPEQQTRGYEYWQRVNPHQHKPLTLEQKAEAGLVLVGSPETVVRQVAAQIEALDTSHIICDFWRSTSMENREATMRLFAEEVMAKFKNN